MGLKQIEEVIAAVRSNGGYIIDDDAPVQTAFKPACLGIMTNNQGDHVIPIFHSWKFPNTPIFIGEDGKPHMKKVDNRIFNTQQIQAFDMVGEEAGIKLVFDN